MKVNTSRKFKIQDLIVINEFKHKIQQFKKNEIPFNSIELYYNTEILKGIREGVFNEYFFYSKMQKLMRSIRFEVNPITSLELRLIHDK